MLGAMLHTLLLLLLAELGALLASGPGEQGGFSEIGGTFLVGLSCTS